MAQSFMSNGFVFGGQIGIFAHLRFEMIVGLAYLFSMKVRHLYEEELYLYNLVGHRISYLYWPLGQVIL